MQGLSTFSRTRFEIVSVTLPVTGRTEISVLGDRADGDGWAAVGATGSSYADVLPYPAPRRPRPLVEDRDQRHAVVAGVASIRAEGSAAQARENRLRRILTRRRRVGEGRHVEPAVTGQVDRTEGVAQCHFAPAADSSWRLSAGDVTRPMRRLASGFVDDNACLVGVEHGDVPDVGCQGGEILLCAGPASLYGVRQRPHVPPIEHTMHIDLESVLRLARL